jgi:transcription elongation factor Elf1
MTNTRPLPCPFCGKLRWRFLRDPGTWATTVDCTNCGARGPLCIPSKHEALAAWSERATIPQEPPGLTADDVLLPKIVSTQP